MQLEKTWSVRDGCLALRASVRINGQTYNAEETFSVPSLGMLALPPEEVNRRIRRNLMRCIENHLFAEDR